MDEGKKVVINYYNLFGKEVKYILKWFRRHNQYFSTVLLVICESLWYSVRFNAVVEGTFCSPHNKIILVMKYENRYIEQATIYLRLSQSRGKKVVK